MTMEAAGRQAPHGDAPLRSTARGSHAAHLAARHSADVAVHPGLIACEGCDAVYSWRSLVPGECAHCRRCGNLLGRGHGLGVDGQLALAVASAIVFAIANLSAIVTLESRGVDASLTLMSALALTWMDGEPTVALLAAAVGFVFPLVLIVLRLWLLLPLVAGRRPPRAARGIVLLQAASRWSMVEVLMLGLLIAVVRSAGLADVVVGPGLFAWGLLTVLMAASDAVGTRGLWRRAVPLDDAAPGSLHARAAEGARP